MKILGVYGIFDCLPRGGRNVVTFSLNFYTKENFIIERTGVCVWLIGKTSSQNIRKGIWIQLNGRETEIFFGSLYENDIRFFKSIQRALKKVKYLDLTY